VRARQARKALAEQLGFSPILVGRIDEGGRLLHIPGPLVLHNLVEHPAEHVVIGWKDTREARHAVRDALPFLQRATRVSVVEACGTSDEKTALGRLDDVARYLTHHRVEGGPKSCSSRRAPVQRN
jgi:hypothetical protein